MHIVRLSARPLGRIGAPQLSPVLVWVEANERGFILTELVRRGSTTTYSKLAVLVTGCSG